MTNKEKKTQSVDLTVSLYLKHDSITSEDIIKKTTMVDIKISFGIYMYIYGYNKFITELKHGFVFVIFIGFFFCFVFLL